MSGIDELRRRVREAEQHFGLIDEQHVRYSERLISLMDAVEQRVRSQQDELDRVSDVIARHEEENEGERQLAQRLRQENEQLRQMLHSLLGAIEAGGRARLVETMQAMESKVSLLVGHPMPALAPPPAPAVAEESPVPEPATFAEEGADLAPAADEPEATSEAVIATAPAEARHDPTTSLNDIMERVSRLVQHSDAEGATREPEAGSDDSERAAEGDAEGWSQQPPSRKSGASS